MNTDIAVMCGSAYAISFKNTGHHPPSVAVIICQNSKVFYRELGKLEKLPHIKILSAEPSRVAIENEG